MAETSHCAPRLLLIPQADADRFNRAPTQRRAAIARDLRAHVRPRLESWEMKVVIHHIFPLADAAAAHRMMEGQHVGKILLQVR